MSRAAPLCAFEAPGVAGAVAAAHREAVASLGLLEADGLERLLASGSAEPAGEGRGATWVVALPGGSDRLHLRPLRHGGWLSGLTGSRILRLARPVSELRATAALRARGVPVPEPVVVCGRRRGLFWEACVGTVYEEGSVGARTWLRGDPDPRDVIRAARAAGRAVRRFHDAGARHADLHVGNLLVRIEPRVPGPEPEILVTDLDQSRLVERIGPGRRMQELMRLHRSLDKNDLLAVIGARGLAAFFGSYVAGDRDLRQALRSRLPRERLRGALHALAWRGVAGSRH